MSDSKELFERACRVIPGGVNSPVRAFGSVGGSPVYFERGEGSSLFSAEGREYIDFCGSWGPLILGHAHPTVVETIKSAAASGTSFGANTEREIELAEFLCERISHADMVRLMNSGTEAVMTALRIARAETGRSRIIKFDGCYHGHSDSLLVSAGSGLLTSGESFSDGIPRHVTADVLVAPYNHIDAVKEITGQYSDIAAIIVEPIAGNMGMVHPRPGFLEALREIADQIGAVLIFDEVITGFRFGPTLYSDLCGVKPDLTCLGKIIGGGMPIGAVAGRAELMKRLAPEGKVYQAGTLSGNPVAVAAGLATLRTLIKLNPYKKLEALTERLAAGVNTTATEQSAAVHCAQTGSAFTVFFSGNAVGNLDDAKACDTEAFAKFFHGMLDRGIYMPPSQFELNFISAAHSEDDIDAFLSAADELIRS